MSKFLKKPILGRIEVVGGRFVFKGGFIEIGLSYTEDFIVLQKLSALESEDGEMATLTILNEKNCMLGRFPAINIGDVIVLNYDTALYTNIFSSDKEYLKDNFKINGERCINPSSFGSLYVKNDNGYYQVKRLDNNKESLTYTKFVDMKLKDLDTIDSTALLLHLQEKYNKNFLYYLGN